MLGCWEGALLLEMFAQRGSGEEAGKIEIRKSDDFN
jgi:hypothetical protein